MSFQCNVKFATLGRHWYCIDLALKKKERIKSDGIKMKTRLNSNKKKNKMAKETEKKLRKLKSGKQ